MMEGNHQLIKEIIQKDAWRVEKLSQVRSLDLPDCWIGAGFVRNKVWDYLHGYTSGSVLNDLDVIFFDPSNTDKASDLALERRLIELDPTANWSVKNQARMHQKHGHLPYKNCEDAISNWVEAPTCIAARLSTSGVVELIAPHGTSELMSLKVSPTQAFRTFPQKQIFIDRVNGKNWLKQWPELQLIL